MSATCIAGIQGGLLVFLLCHHSTVARVVFLQYMFSSLPCCCTFYTLSPTWNEVLQKPFPSGFCCCFFESTNWTKIKMITTLRIQKFPNKSVQCHRYTHYASYSTCTCIFQIPICETKETFIPAWLQQLIWASSSKLHVQYMCAHMFTWSIFKFFITHEPNLIWRWNLHPSTSLVESRKALKAHGCKPWVTNLSVVPHTLGIPTANVTYCIILLWTDTVCVVCGLQNVTA